VNEKSTSTPLIFPISATYITIMNSLFSSCLVLYCCSVCMSACEWALPLVQQISAPDLIIQLSPTPKKLWTSA